MDFDGSLSKMRDANSRTYRAAARAASALRAVVFVAVISAMLAGGVLTAADGIVTRTEEVRSSAPAARPAAAVKSCRSFSLSPEEDARDLDAELLQTLYVFDRRSVPDGMVGIIPISLYREPEEGKVWVSDAGDKKMIDVDEYLERSLPVGDARSDGYTVLRIHTHGTEAFSEEWALYAEPGSYPRSTDPEKNVIAIGEIFADALNAAGIKTLHCREPVDARSYSNAYSNAADIIKEYIKEYPGIKYLLDIHRDSVDLTDGSKTRMVTACNGQPTAQVMFVVGTDRLVSANKNWRDNMALAVRLQTELEAEYPGLMRPINVKHGAFNQYFTPLSLLIEIGCDGNSMAEAKRAARIVADRLVKTMTGR